MSALEDTVAGLELRKAEVARRRAPSSGHDQATDRGAPSTAVSDEEVARAVDVLEDALVYSAGARAPAVNASMRRALERFLVGRDAPAAGADGAALAAIGERLSIGYGSMTQLVADLRWLHARATTPHAAHATPALAPGEARGGASPLGLALAPLAPDDLAYLLIAATRYQLPRMTYGSMIVAGALRAVWPAFTENARAVLRRDIEDALRRGEAGHVCDQREWERVLAGASAEADRA